MNRLALASLLFAVASLSGCAGCGEVMDERADGGAPDAMFDAGTGDATLARGDGAFEAAVDAARDYADASDADDAPFEAEAGPCPFAGPSPWSGSALWALPLTPEGSSSAAYVNGIAVAPNGDVVLVGSFVGSVNVSGQTLTSPDVQQALVARFGADGKLVFAETFPAGCATSSCQGLTQGAFGVAVDPSGDIVVGGGYQGQMTIPGSPAGMLDSGGGPQSGTDLFVTKLDPSGQHLWSKSFGSAPSPSSFAEAVKVALDAEGDIVLGGNFTGPLDFFGSGDDGGNGFVAVEDAFVAKLGPSGDPLWARQLANSRYADVRGLALDPAGNAYVAGSVAGALGFQGPGVDAGNVYDASVDPCMVLPNQCLQTAYVVKVSPAGDLDWAQGYPDLGQGATSAVAVDGTGVPMIIGWAMNIAFLDGGPAWEYVDEREFMLRLDPKDGTTTWSAAFGGAGGSQQGIARDVLGNTVLAGQTWGNVTLPDGYDAGGIADGEAFVARLTPDGSTTWARTLPGEYLQLLAADRCQDEIFVAGGTWSTSASVSILDGSTLAVGQFGGVLARIAP